MRSVFAFSAIVLLFSGCSAQDPISNSIREMKTSLRYFKDEHTELCFAAVLSRTYDDYNVMSITAVPCANIPQGLLIK